MLCDLKTNMTAKTLKLNSGFDMPVVGLGTWKSDEGKVKAAAEKAIDCGYRHIDCAWLYKNEKEVGDAIEKKIKEGKVKREELFITSKLWCTFHEPNRVREAFMESLKNLKLEYMDLYLMHFPVGFQYSSKEAFPSDENGLLTNDIDYMETWKAMESLQKEGLVRSIGISNFNIFQTDRIINEGSIPPAVNQIELHPYMVQANLVENCKKRGIVVTSYSPLGSGDRPWKSKDDPVLLEDSKLVKIASKVKKSVAQVLIKFQVQRGLTVLPKSVTPSRIEANMQIFDFELSDEDMATITSLDKNFRACPWHFCMEHKYSPFKENYSE